MFLGKPFAFYLKSTVSCACVAMCVSTCARVFLTDTTLELRDPQWSLRLLVLFHKNRNKPEEHPYLYNGSLGLFCLLRKGDSMTMSKLTVETFKILEKTVESSV